MLKFFRWLLQEGWLAVSYQLGNFIKCNLKIFCHYIFNLILDCWWYVFLGYFNLRITYVVSPSLILYFFIGCTWLLLKLFYWCFMQVYMWLNINLRIRSYGNQHLSRHLQFEWNGVLLNMSFNPDCIRCNSRSGLMGIYLLKSLKVCMLIISLNIFVINRNQISENVACNSFGLLFFS